MTDTEILAQIRALLAANPPTGTPPVVVPPVVKPPVVPPPPVPTGKQAMRAAVCLAVAFGSGGPRYRELRDSLGGQEALNTVIGQYMGQGPDVDNAYNGHHSSPHDYGYVWANGGWQSPIPAVGGNWDMVTQQFV